MADSWVQEYDEELDVAPDVVASLLRRRASRSAATVREHDAAADLLEPLSTAHG